MYFPLVNQMGVTIILFSTPDAEDSGSWFTMFLKEKPNEILQTIFDQVCPDCMKKDILEWQNCTHQKFEGSLMKDVDSDRLKNLLNQEDYMQEIKGVTQSKDVKAFDEESLNYVFNKNNWVDVDFKKVRFVFGYVDTNFGGVNESAVVFVCSTDNVNINIILWASSLSTKNPEDSRQFFKDNILNFRDATKTYDIPLIIAYETVSNYSAHEAELYVRELAENNEKKFSKIFFMYEPDWIGTERQRAGVNIYGSRKDLIVKTHRERLLKKGLRIYKGIGTCSKRNINDLLTLYHKQLSLFRSKTMCEVIERRKNRMKLENKYNSGKMRINGELFNDDLAFSDLGANFFKEIFEYDKNTLSQRQTINKHCGKTIFQY